MNRFSRLKPEHLPKIADLFRLSTTRKKHLTGLLSLMLEMTNRGHKPEPEEQQELAETLLEILSPESLSAVADLEEGVPPQARKKLDRWRKMVGKAIRIYRIQRNWTQADLAGRTGLPQSHVSRLETGKHAASHLTIQRIADALGLKPSDITRPRGRIGIRA